MRQISMPSAGFKPAVTASERPQTHTLLRAATEIGLSDMQQTQNTVRYSVLQCHCAIARNVCSSAVYENPNSASERRIRDENLYYTKVRVVRKPKVRKSKTACIVIYPRTLLTLQESRTFTVTVMTVRP